MPILPIQGESLLHFVRRVIAGCRGRDLSTENGTTYVTAVFNDVELYIRADSDETAILRIYDLEFAAIAARQEYASLQKTLEEVLAEQKVLGTALTRLEERYQQPAPPLLEGLAIGDVMEVLYGGESSAVTHIGYGPHGIVAVWGEGDEMPWVLYQDGTQVEGDDPPVVSVRRKAN